MKRKCFFIAILFIYITKSYCQDEKYQYVKSTYDITWLDLKVTDKNINFNRLVEDNDGYLWLSSSNGLLCFDGYNTIIHKNGNIEYPVLKDSIKSHFGRLKKDFNGNIYADLFYANKIVSYNPYLRKLNFVYPKNKSLQTLNYSEVSKNGQLYFISENKETYIETLYKVDNNKEVPLFELNTANNETDYINDIEFDEENFYITTYDFIYVVSKNGKLLFKINNVDQHKIKFSTTDVKKIYFMNRSSNKISVWNNQINKIQIVFTFPDDRTYFFERIAVKNEFIVCANEYEIFIINTKTKTIQNLKDDWLTLKKMVFNKSTINSIMDVDIITDGSILITTEKNVYKLTKKVSENIFFKEKIIDQEKELSFREITKDAVGNIYVSYYIGIAKKNRNSNNFHKINYAIKNLKLDGSYSLSYWNNNLLWNNISYNLETKKTEFLTNDSNKNHATQLILKDSIWIYNWYSTTLSVRDLKSKKGIDYAIDKAAYPNKNLGIVNDLIESSNNNLWMATQGNGLSLITKKGKLVKHYSNKQIDANINSGILCLYQNKNKLWFGVNNGLNFLDIKTNSVNHLSFPYVSRQGELLQRKVYFILPNNANQFYLGTDFGLLLFDSKTFEYFELSSHNPLSYQEYNRKSKFYDAKENKFYVGTISGLYSFKPENLEWHKPTKGSKLRITKISVIDKRNKFKHYSENVNELKRIELKADELSLEINYSAVKKHTDLFYSYRIKEINDRWSKYTKEQQLILTGLKSGKYNIEFRTLNGDNSSFKSIEVVKAQYWYLRWYVQLVFFLLIIGLVVWIIRYLYQQKLKKQKELIKLRNKISRDLHDEVGTILTAVSMQSEILIRNTNSQDASKLNKISVMSRQAMNSMRDTVWSIDSEKDNAMSLIDRMKDFLLDAFEDNDKITYTFHYYPKEKQTQTLKPDVRQNIYLIFKEAVINTLKHSNGDMLVVNLQITKSSISLNIQDNGKASSNLRSSGLGLRNMQKRAKKINANFKISNRNEFLIEVDLEL